MTAVGDLIRQRLAVHDLTLEELAANLAPAHPGKALRKLYRLIDDGKGSPAFLARIYSTLGVDIAERDAAFDSDQRSYWERIEAHQRERFLPHVWIEVTRDWFPSLLTVTGPDIYRRIQIPVTWATQDEESALQQARLFVAEHFESERLRVPRHQVSNYVYRRAFDLGYRLSTTGELIETIARPYLAPVWGCVLA